MSTASAEVSEPPCPPATADSRRRLDQEGITLVQLLDSSGQSDRGAVLAEAVRVLAAVAGMPSGGAADERRVPAGWDGFVTLALARAAATLGHIGAVLAGRPGSGEAAAGPALSVFDLGDPFDALLAKLLANGCGRRWTVVDVGGRGGGAILTI